jgi:hypothetical protein
LLLNLTGIVICWISVFIGADQIHNGDRNDHSFNWLANKSFKKPHTRWKKKFKDAKGVVK